jgi:hypothetical protein
MDIQKHDEEIKRLFNSGFGARHIAEKLGIVHHASISKRLRRMNLKRGHCVSKCGILQLELKSNLKSINYASECYARYFFVSCGYNVFVPEPGAPYDLLVEIGDKFQKIQVKSSHNTKNSDNCAFTLIRTRNNATSSKKTRYTSDECDYFFLFDVFGNKWLIPFSELKNAGNVVPKLRYPGYQVYDPWSPQC